MKTQSFPRVLFCSIGALALSGTTARAALPITAGTVTETFTTQPPNTSWSTTAAVYGTGGATITGDATADSRVGTPTSPTGDVTATLVSAILPAAAISGTVAPQIESRYHNTAGYVSTASTTGDATLLMATLNNGTGAPIVSLGVRYDLSIQNGNVATPEAEIPGHRVYWSLTGLANSWTPIGDFGFRGVVGAAAVQTVSQSFNVPFTNWAAGTNAYLLWLDDNAATNPDGLYYLDNIAFTVVPEPGVSLLASAALLACGGRRQRRSRALTR